MVKFVFFSAFICISSFVYSQKQSIVCLETNDDYYKWISFLSEGKIDWFDDIIDNVEGESYRFVVTSSEIYNNIYIERITLGPEGCCRKIVSKKEVPIDNVFKAFNITGERSGVQFIDWKSPTSLVFSIWGNKYLMENINEDKVLISKL